MPIAEDVLYTVTGINCEEHRRDSEWFDRLFSTTSPKQGATPTGIAKGQQPVVKCKNLQAEEHLHTPAELAATKAKPDAKSIDLVTPTKQFATKPEASNDNNLSDGRNEAEELLLTH